MITVRRDWVLLTLTLTGAGIGQWVWLTHQWPFVLGFACYVAAVASWLKLTRAFSRRPVRDRTVQLAWIGGGVFGALALLVGLRGPEQVPVALILTLAALGYVSWAFSKGLNVAGVRSRASYIWTTRRADGLLVQAVGTRYAEFRDQIASHPVQVVLIAGSVLIITGAGLAAHRGVRPTAHLVSLAAWGIGLMLFVVAFLPPGLPGLLSDSLRRLVTQYRFETAFLLAILCLAAALRGLKLGSIPIMLSGDEGAMGLEAAKVLRGEQVNPFSTGWTSHPTLYFYHLALVLRFLGQNIPALRIGSVLAGAFTVPVTYLLARVSFNRTVAIISALFLTGYHVHIHYSRLALNNVWAPFAAVATFLCLWAGLQLRQSSLFALGGITMGLGQYSYFGARLLPLIVIAWMLFLIFTSEQNDAASDVARSNGQDRRLKLAGNGWHLVVFFLAFMLTLLPLSWFFIEHWTAFNARLEQVGVFGSTGADPSQVGYVFPLVSGLFRSVTAFNYTRDRSIFYGPPLPMLHWLSGIGFVFGLVEAIRSRRDPACGLLLIWLAGTVVFGGALMNNPPESPRLLFAAPATAVLVALGLTRLSRKAVQVVRETSSRRWLRSICDGRALAVIAALIATGISAFYYFGVYTPSLQFGDRKTQIAHHLGVWARDLDPNRQVYFFGAPYMTYAGFPSIAFIAPHARIQDVMKPIDNPPPIKGESTFVFVAQRLDELDIIRTAHPDGRRWEMIDDHGRLLFVSYEVDQAALTP